MNIHPYAKQIFKQVTQWRQHMHANPEIGLKEFKTSAFIKQKLDEMHITYQEFADTGVVATLTKGTGNRAIGFRADIDALPMPEESDIAYKSTNDGMMHACGHDGHTAILLGAAQALNKVGEFDGTIYLIFQPGEEGWHGADAMIKDGLFEKCPMDEVYALHNWPGMPIGVGAATKGAIMAAGDEFIITIKGQGSHAALPQLSTDPVVIGCQLINALQTITSRNVDPVRACVISTTMSHGGSAKNVIPDSIEYQGTVRTFDPDIRDLAERRISEIGNGFALAFGCDITVNYIRGYQATINHDKPTEYAGHALGNVVGSDNVIWDHPPSMGGEDFSDMLAQVEGNYIWLGVGDTSGLHTTTYNFDDNLIPVGMSYWLEMARTRLPVK